MKDRLPPIPPEQWNAEQRRRALDIISGPRGALVSPFIPLLRSPELMTLTQQLGEYLRYRSAIGVQLSELAILVIARRWSQRVEWAVHAPIARAQGLSESLIRDVAAGRKPGDLSTEQEVVYDFCVELQDTKHVSDSVWKRAVDVFGEHGVVDLIGINGYYSYLAMLMNAAGTPPPASDAPPLA